MATSKVAFALLWIYLILMILNMVFFAIQILSIVKFGFSWPAAGTAGLNLIGGLVMRYTWLEKVKEWEDG